MLNDLFLGPLVMTYSTPRFASLTRILAAAIVIGSVAMAPSRAVAAAFRTVALTGQGVPGEPGGVNYLNFPNAPALNGNGQTAFIGAVAGPSVTSANNLGVWSEGVGSLALVARKGDQAAGASVGENFSDFNAITLNDAGKTAFTGALSGWSVTGSNESGSWSEGSGSLALVAREGNQAPGAPVGVLHDSLFGPAPAFNDHGATAFFANLIGSGVTMANDTSILSNAGGALAIIAREGSPAAGTPAGVNYGSLLDPVVLNNAGQTAFAGFLSGAGVTNANSNGLWAGAPNALALVARSGDQAPGLEAGVIYASFTVPAINAAGEVAFRASVVSAISLNDSGIWSQKPGGLALIAHKGSQAPGAPSGVNFNLFEPPVLNDAGQVAFIAMLVGGGVSGTNNEGIWVEQSGSLAMIARRGDHAPGTPDGVHFGSFSLRRGTNAPALNVAGQVAFQAMLTGGAVSSSNDAGIWATDVAGTLRLVVREGDDLEVLPGDFRTVNALGFLGNAGNGDGRPSAFNGRGQLAFLAWFSDGSRGIFVSSRVAVPEAGAGALVGLGLAGVTLSRKRRVA